MKKYLIILPCVLSIVLMSCDRRTSKSEHLKKAVSDFNNQYKLNNTNNYYPETYTEIKTDSIVSNTFRVSIKNYSLNDRSIFTKHTSKEKTNTKALHRVFACDLIVSVSDKIVLKEYISADTFQAYESSEFWNNATLEHVWVNHDTSNDQKLSLGVSFINPLNDNYKLYELLVDNHGNERIVLIEEHS